MGYYDFPHTRNYDTDLGYLIKRYFELNTDFESLEKNFNDLKAWCIAQLNSEALKTLVANKLDEWLQDGTLASLINNALLHVTTYDTVVEMLTHTGLENGSKIYCAGADTVNDGNGGHFRIRARLSTDTIDNYNLYLIDGGVKVAERITDISINYVTPEMFGAIGDGITDDTAAINRALENSENKILYFTKTYLIDGAVTTDVIDNHGLKVRSNTVIRFIGGSKIIQKPSNASESHIFILLGCENVDISGGCIEGDYLTHTTESGTTDEWCHGIEVISSKNIHIHDMTIKNCYGDGIYIGQSGTRVSSIPADNHCRNVTLENIIIDKCGRNGIALTDCNNWYINNIKISNVQRTEPKSGIDVEVEGNYSPFVSSGVISNIHTDSCDFGIKLFYNTENITLENCDCNRIYPYSNSGIVYIDHCHAPLSIHVTAVNVYDSTIVGFQAEGDKLCSMYNSSLHVYDSNSAQIELYLVNTILESVFNFPKSVTLKNCTIKHDGVTSYSIRLAGKKAILDGCIFIINGNVGQTPINDATTEKLTVTNSHIEGNATNLGFPFVSTNKTAYINNNNYYPCSSIAYTSPLEGCVNFSY